MGAVYPAALTRNGMHDGVWIGVTHAVKHAKLVAGTFFVTLFLWGLFSWPLALHMGSAIPASSHNSGKQQIRQMVPGDHLQFLYHLWLGKDTLFGPTPLFHDLYEFNTGNDEDRYEVSKYYLPFSLFFSLGAATGSQAFGSNLAGILSLWLTLLFTYILARRYTTDPVVAALAAGVTVILPYRWFNLLGGSPTGLAMMWVPIAFLGLDWMVRKRCPWGAAIAGLAIYVSEWSDTHTVFFLALAAPCWCIVAYLHDRDTLLPSWPELRKLVGAAIPLIVCAVVVIVVAANLKGSMSNTDIGQSGGRPLEEVLLCSYKPAALFALARDGAGREIYLGRILPGLLLLGLAGWIWDGIRRGRAARYRLAAGLLLALGIVGVLMLAGGPRMEPGGVRAWRLLTRVIPPYGMIRQPAKIFILLPSLVAVALACFLPALATCVRLHRRAWIAWGIVGALLLIDYKARISPAICKLDLEQGAYRAVHEDAQAAGNDARMLAIPLWPGNSHWSSLDLYYASLYRIRMVNGYRPTVRQPYLNNIYLPFEQFNAGNFPDVRLDDLVARGVDYLALHENAFPEKVSPFSVSHTLYELLAHPRIKLLAQDGPVWTFKLVDAPLGRYADLPNWPYRFPARLWQGERSETTNAIVMETTDASGGKYMHLNSTNAVTWLRTDRFPFSNRPPVSYLARLRGSGTCTATLAMHTADGNGAPQTTRITFGDGTAPGDWQWHTLPLRVANDSYPEVDLTIVPLSGHVDVDLVVPVAQGWDPTARPRGLVLPAPMFFHAGHTDLASGAVVFEPVREPADAIFYGPKLPMPAGQYTVTLAYASEAPDGTVLGELRPRYPSPRTTPTPVIAGQPAILDYHLDTNLRLAIDFVYSATAPMRIHTVTIDSRDKDAPQ